jgi:DNA invertase Pin-like site-specific DNA recombinase
MILTYAYERVSTKDQNLERQDIAIKQYRPQIAEANIFKDKLTGKSFDRPEYNAMKIILEHLSHAYSEGDMIELVVEELDRLGRSAEGIKRELQWFKEHHICVRILEIPTTLIDIKPENAWVMELINQILVETYSAVAEQELEKRAKRQSEGIAVAKDKGVRFGRKSIEVNEQQFIAAYEKWKANEITAVQAMRYLDLKPNTFYRRVKEFETRKANEGLHEK